MAEASRDVKHSPTFRKGTTGQWRSEFSEEHVRLFKETDKNGELVRLGFAKDRDW